MLAAFYKVVAFTGIFRPGLGAHSLIKLNNAQEIQYNTWVPVDHFKFTKNVIEKLYQHIRTGDIYWIPESQRLLDFIKIYNNTIGIKDPAIYCNIYTAFDIENCNVCTQSPSSVKR